jgi:hypothetical protein
MGKSNHSAGRSAATLGEPGCRASRLRFMNTMLWITRTGRRVRNRRLQIGEWSVDPPVPIEIRHVEQCAWDGDLGGAEVAVLNGASIHGKGVLFAKE